MDYLELATDIPDEELAYIGKQLDERATNPMEIKKRLARDVVAQFHGDAAAQAAGSEWSRTFQQGEEPGTVLEFAVPARSGDGGLEIDLFAVLVDSGLVPSKGEARRLVRQGGVEIDGGKVGPDEAAALTVAPGSLLRVGKHRFLRVVGSKE
jgi:tyrosyl-tRNA synthetase